jgi:hypothetical protein
MLIPFSFIKTGGYDPDAQAFFARVTAAGGTLSTTEKNATNQLVLDMKSAGIWSAMRAVYPMVGASAAACAQNLKSSSFTGTFSSGWTFASTGVTPNGTSAYMDTTFNPFISSSNNNVHLSHYVRDYTALVSGKVLMGSVVPPAATTINWSSNGAFYYPTMQEFSFPTLPTFPSIIKGLLIGRRINSTQEALFINSTKYELSQSSNNLLPNNSIYIGSNHVSGAQQFTDAQCAFASIGDGLTDTQASDFYTAVQTFNQTLNRQV